MILMQNKFANIPRNQNFYAYIDALVIPALIHDFVSPSDGFAAFKE